MSSVNNETFTGGELILLCLGFHLAPDQSELFVRPDKVFNRGENINDRCSLAVSIYAKLYVYALLCIHTCSNQSGIA